MQTIETLEAIRRTLDVVEVKGKANLDRMLGAMMAIEKLIAEMKEENNGNGKT